MTLLEKHKQTIDQFKKMSEELIVGSRSNKASGRLDDKLWLLPRSVVHYLHKVATDEEKKQVEPLLMDLRAKAASMINALPEMVDKKKTLSDRITTDSQVFKFRRWSLDDLSDFVSLLDDEDMWRLIPEDYPAPLSLDDAASLMDTSNNIVDRHTVHAVEWQGNVIGQARVLFDRSSAQSAEISYWLGKKYWGAGFASRFVPMYTRESFMNNPIVDRIVAKVVEGNDASIRLLEKAGYRYESFNYQNVKKYGKKLNTHIFSVYRASYI